MMLYSMKPPPLAVNNRQVLIPGVIQFSRHFRTQQSFSCYAAGLTRSFYLPLTSPSALFGWPYLSCSMSTRRECPALRNFDTEPQSSYRYEVRSDNRLESVANAHTAADLHVRPVSQTALVSRAVGAANVLRDTSCLNSRNGNDSMLVPAKTTSHWQIRAGDFAASSNGLNLRTDSICGAAVIFLRIA